MQPDLDTGGPAANNVRIYPRDSRQVAEMARRIGVLKNRDVSNPEVLAALVRYGNEHFSDIAELIPG